MSENTEYRPKARLPRGMRDRFAADVMARRRMLDTLCAVYESYGFDPLETSALEYADALGKFLPDQDRPMGGVFGVQDEDEWLALRYDLTAPLARLVAQNFDTLPKPFRRYQVGPVWRNEKPGPGRYREFYQVDADTVGASSMAADAELCAMLCDGLEALGIRRGDYRIRVNNRKILNGVLETIGIAGADAVEQRGRVLRAIDKLDRLGPDAVRALLGGGRMDESGDFTEGAGLSGGQADVVLAFTAAGQDDRGAVLGTLRNLVGASAEGLEGIAELEAIGELVDSGGYAADRIAFDPGVVRGLDYYTGPVFEGELTFEIRDEAGRPVRFGAVAGGGRYDGLVERFLGRKVPATGASIGVDRLAAALDALRSDAQVHAGPVVVLVLDRARLPDYQRMVAELRAAGVRAELYLGDSGMRAQLKYADKRNAPVAVIVGEDEFVQGTVTIKDLMLGAALSGAIQDREEWRRGQPAQQSVPRAALCEAVRAVLNPQPA